MRTGQSSLSPRAAALGGGQQAAQGPHCILCPVRHLPSAPQDTHSCPSGPLGVLPSHGHIYSSKYREHAPGWLCLSDALLPGETLHQTRRFLVMLFKGQKGHYLFQSAELRRPTTELTNRVLGQQEPRALQLPAPLSSGEGMST